MRDPIITEAIMVLREHQADHRAAGRIAEADAGDGYIDRISLRFPDGVRRPAPLVKDRRRK